MLKISEIKEYITTAIKLFLEEYPDFSVPEIVVCPSSRRKEARDKIIAECGLESKEDIYGTDAEVIIGKLNTKIILYQSSMKTKQQVYHAVWHELGHLMFGSEKQFDIDLNEDTPMRSGYAVINEFMAEFIAYTVNKFESFSDSHDAQIYLQMTFVEETVVNPYWFSRYLAVIIGDGNVSEEEFNDGEKYVFPEAWELIVETAEKLFEQTDKDNFWKVSVDFLKEIGILYDELFHIYYSLK